MHVSYVTLELSLLVRVAVRKQHVVSLSSNSDVPDQVKPSRSGSLSNFERTMLQSQNREHKTTLSISSELGGQVMP